MGRICGRSSKKARNLGRISQVIYTGFGGLGSVAFSLVEADRDRTVDWSIAFIGDQPIDPSYPPRCEALSVRWAEFRSTPGRPYPAWWRLGRWLDEGRPDGVLLHSINSVLPARWATRRRGSSLVAVEHMSNAVKSRSEWAASRLAMTLADRVVVLTPEYREELAEAHGRLFRARKISVIPNGIDTAVFRPREHRDGSPGTVTLGMAARFSFSKRQDLLVDVVEEIRRRRPDVDWRLRLAGSGDRFAEVREKARSSGLDPFVAFDGLLPEADIAPWLRALDIYVHASEGETLSTSLLQAMATGLPIVASDIPGIRNLLGPDSKYGLLADNTADAFAEKIDGSIGDLSLSSEMAGRARARAVADYSNFTMLERYLGLLGGTGS
jgi:glycosyltransferase involved in cell wall biosynthesis